jgi:hypothetical protein
MATPSMMAPNAPMGRIKELYRRIEHGTDLQRATAFFCNLAMDRRYRIFACF